jgi:hypothetical protein
VNLLNARGIVLLAVVLADCQDVLVTPLEQQGHWLRVAERLRGSGTLLSGGNEWAKNHFDPGNLSDPGMLWSRGSDVENKQPFAPYGAFCEFHGVRHLPTALTDAVSSAVFLYEHGVDRPLIADEPPRFGTDGSGSEYLDPRLAWRFARHFATEWAGAVFHSRSGQRSELMDPVTRACAVAWCRGMTL